MQHLDEGTIHSWLDGALDSDEAARVEAHVKECPECAAAVAEARGFIAASSRILTALDNEPRGVIPAAAPKRRFDPLVWRVAATVLVVAAGTLVVVQNRGSEAATGPTATAPVATGPAATAAIQAAPETTVGKAPMIALPKKGVAGAQRTADNALERKTLSARAPGSTGQQNTQSSGYAMEAAPTAPTVSEGGISGAVAMDAAAEPERLKVVGTPRALGLKITLYEVAPGDTVTLTEPMAVALSGVVTTGAIAASRGAREKAMAPPSTARADVATEAAPDAQRSAVAQSTSVPTRTPSAPASVKQVQVANGVTTISWADPNTGNVLRLSGRMSEARLQQIKIRIERERATAVKKIP